MHNTNESNMVETKMSSFDLRHVGLEYCKVVWSHSSAVPLFLTKQNFCSLLSFTFLLLIGYLEGTFDLIWQKKTTDEPVKKQVVLQWKSSTTLCELDMPSAPTKTYLSIREKQDDTILQRAQQVTPHEFYTCSLHC